MNWEGEGDIVNWEGEGDIVNCKSDLGGLGDLVRSAYAFYFLAPASWCATRGRMHKIGG